MPLSSQSSSSEIDEQDAEAIRGKEARSWALGWTVSNPGFNGEHSVGSHSARKLTSTSVRKKVTPKDDLDHMV